MGGHLFDQMKTGKHFVSFEKKFLMKKQVDTSSTKWSEADTFIFFLKKIFRH